MRYLRDGGFWDAWVSFPPVGGQVEVLISGRESGPGQEQRAFLAEVERRYQSLWPEVERELSGARAADPSADASGRWILKGIDIPASVAGEPGWELLYETEPAWLFCAVQMKGWTPVNVSVEC